MTSSEPKGTDLELWRWVILAAMIGLGIVSFFYYGPRTRPVVHPPAAEAGE